MANTLRIRRRTSGAAGAPSTIENAELAFNEVDDTLYYGEGTAGIGGSGTALAIAGPGAFTTLTSTQTISGDKTFSGAINVPTPSSNTHAATKLYVDSVTGALATSFTVAGDTGSSQTITSGTDTLTITGGTGLSSVAGITDTVTINLDNTSVSAASYGSAGTVATFTVDAQGRLTAAANSTISITANQVTDFDTQVRTNRLDQMAAPIGSFSVNGQKITSLADPTSAQDAATKAYVDAARMGMDVKESVRAATTANITLSGEQTIDGISIVTGDRVLVKSQSTGSQNGIYVASAGSWSRSTDADSNSDVTTGMFSFVSEGTINADSGWVLTTNDTITLNTTSLVFSQFSGTGQITAGDGLTKSGNTLSVGGTSDRITINSDTVDIASTYVGQNTITTLGTIATGTWNGTTIAIANGGTGSTSASDARTALGLAIGTNVQAYDAELMALAGLTSAADSLPYFTGSGTASLATLTTFGRSLIDDVDATAARVTLALGTMAIQNANAVAITGGTLSAITISNSIIDGGTF